MREFRGLRSKRGIKGLQAGRESPESARREEKKNCRGLPKRSSTKAGGSTRSRSPQKLEKKGSRQFGKETLSIATWGSMRIRPTSVKLTSSGGAHNRRREEGVKPGRGESCPKKSNPGREDAKEGKKVSKKHRFSQRKGRRSPMRNEIRRPPEKGRKGGVEGRVERRAGSHERRQGDGRRKSRSAALNRRG